MDLGPELRPRFFIFVTWVMITEPFFVVSARFYLRTVALPDWFNVVLLFVEKVA